MLRAGDLVFGMSLSAIVTAGRLERNCAVRLANEQRLVRLLVRCMRDRTMAQSNSGRVQVVEYGRRPEKIVRIDDSQRIAQQVYVVAGRQVGFDCAT